MNLKHGFLAISAGMVVAIPTLKAQNFEDALRFSALTTGTTARSMAIGGAAGSLGADYSSASVNPAGMGLYRQSEFTFTPYLNFNGSSSTYIGNGPTYDNNTAFKIGNLGMSFYNNTGRKSGLKSYTFGIGFNKLADFNTHSTYQGVNSQSSFTDLMANEAQIYGVSEQESPLGFLGYQGYLLTDDRRSVPYNNILANGGSLTQTKFNKSKGGVNEININLAGNYNDKLMVGGTVGITTYRFRRTTEFIEADNTGNRNNGFDNFSLIETLQTTGVGIVGKFGMIYSVSPLFRLGASVHTPTYASLTDYVDYDLVSQTENLGNGTHNVVPENMYRSDYSITSPMRAVVSATGFFGTKGFVTADVEYVPYNTMRINYDGAGGAAIAKSQNDFIRENFRGAINGRLGLEVRATNNFSLRAGGAYYANPYLSGLNDLGGDRIDLSLGMGYRFGSNTFIDLTYLRSQQSYSELPYVFNDPSITFYDAKIRNTRNVVALTLGVRF